MKVRVVSWGDMLHFVFLFALFASVISADGRRVVVQPSDSIQEVRRHSRVIIDCIFTSTISNFTISWLRDGEVLQQNKRVYVASNGSLIIERFLYKPKKTQDDDGLYECYVSNIHGTFIARQVELRVSKSSFNITPEKADVVVGGVARFECQVGALSAKTPICVWDHPRQSTDMNRMSSHMGILQLFNVTAEDAGEYTCRYFTSLHTHDVLEKSAFLTVHSGQLPVTPILLNTPQNLSVILGRPALLECLFEGGQNVKISWKYSNGSEVKEERGRINLSGNRNLQFTITVASDAGGYICYIQHERGSLTRNYSLSILEPPEFSIQPAEYLSMVLTAITRLKCQATGNPTPTVSWYKDGLKLYPAPGVQIYPFLILYGRLTDTGYYQCIANNSLGISVATSWVVFERQRNTPDIVTNVTATALSSTQVNVSWSPANAPDGYPVMAYMIDYQLVHDMQCPGRCDFQTKSERDVSNVYYRVINDLKPYTKYRFAVQCLSANGAGSMSEAVTVRTKEDVPTAVPDVQIVPDSSTSFRVSWTEIPESERHGVIDKYQLSYGTKDKMITFIELTADTREYLVTGLEPNTDYVVKVLAGNAAGIPEMENNWLTYKTPPSSSNNNGDAVPSLTLESLNSTSVLISWTNIERGFAGSYRILVQKLIEGGRVKEYNVSGENSHLVVSGLENRVFYKIDFMTRDTDSTPRSYVTELYQAVGPEEEMEPPPPFVLNPTSQSSTFIGLSWEVPKTNVHIVKYTVSYQQRSADGLTSPIQEIESSSAYAYLSRLQPFTWYAIAVRSHSNTSQGPYCKPIIVQTAEGIPSPPENLLAEVVSPGTVKLKWGPPRQQNGIITYYIIYYNSNKDVPDRAWSFIQQNASTTSVVLEDLKNEVYYIKLRACTNAGEGPSSHVIMIDTLDCNTCPKCEPIGSCPNAANKNVVKNGFEQTVGIVIGCAVGLVCIVICVTFVAFKQREMRARYNSRPRTELVGIFNAPAARIDRFLDQDGHSRHLSQTTYSPILRRMMENSGSSFKSENEQRALLSTSSSASVSIQTNSSITDSYDTTPSSSNGDILYQSNAKLIQCKHEPLEDSDGLVEDSEERLEDLQEKETYCFPLENVTGSERPQVIKEASAVTADEESLHSPAELSITEI